VELGAGAGVGFGACGEDVDDLSFLDGSGAGGLEGGLFAVFADLLCSHRWWDCGLCL
jgi:hypothetical protein